MAAQITLDDALASLKSMFPTYEEDALRELLAANRNHIERTIEAVLMMEGEAEIPSGVPPPSTDDSAVSQGGPSSATSGPDTGDLLFGTADDSPKPEPKEGVVDTAQIQKATSNPTKPGRRGVKVNLPEDFLRPPGWRENNQTLGDEQLAIMLQNEMFQREVRANMGDDFVTRMRRTGGRDPNGGASSSSSSSTSRQSQQGLDSRNGTGTAAPRRDSVPDMGIMKGLSSLSAGAKRNLNALAAKFDSKNKTTANSNQTQETGLATYDDPSPRSNARRGLLDKEGSGSDEEEEEIVFGNDPRAHRLDDRDERTL